MNSNKKLGICAEQIALKYLQNRGLTLIYQNFYSRFGEIDLIMQDNIDSLVFIEVKYRSSNLNEALTSISWSKQQKLIRTAQYYLLKHNKEVSCRFDAVIIDKNNHIEWLKNIIIL